MATPAADEQPSAAAAAAAASAALQQGAVVAERMPEALTNLLRNQSYVGQVAEFVTNTYRDALNSGSHAQQCDAVDATHKYAQQALEAIADHIHNCANNLSDFLDCHDRALDELTQQVDLIQHRVKSARQLESIAADPSRVNAVPRPKQCLGNPKIVVEKAFPSFPRFDGWKIDYSQMDRVGTVPAEIISGSYLATGKNSSRRKLQSHGSRSNSRRSMAAAPGPPPSINAPGPPPSVVSAPPGPPPSVGLAAPPSLSDGRRSVSKRYGSARRNQRPRAFGEDSFTQPDSPLLGSSPAPPPPPPPPAL